MLLDYPLDDGEPQARTVAARAPRAVDAVKALEKVGQRRFGDTGAVVEHLEPSPFALLRQRHVDLRRARVQGVLHEV